MGRIKAGFSLRGLEEFEDYLTKMGGEALDIAFEAIEEASTPMVNDMIQRVPVDEGKLKAALEAGKPRKDGFTVQAYVGVDYKKHPKARHAHLQEFGTVKQAAQPFLWPAYKSKKSQSLKAIVETFKRRLGLK